MYPSVDDLFKAILEARRRVYEIAKPTPLQRLPRHIAKNTLVKREDLSPIHAYKWRGSYNCMRSLTKEELDKGVVCASAGNHAQGVALAARKLGSKAKIFMPRSTPLMKQVSAKNIGAESVDIVLEGDSYDDASAAAHAYSESEDMPFIHPYDDLKVMAGQGTLADEVVMDFEGEIDLAYLQIGGGGMAAGVACWLRKYYPDIEIVGVEGVDQASMSAAIEAGEPVTLDYVDVFCDGTAVKKAGSLTSNLCKDLVDRFVTVTNEEICAAIQALWEACRVVPEPAGAMGLAARMKEMDTHGDKTALTVLCGANMDFGQLSWIARHAGIGSARRKYYRFTIPEEKGSLLHLLETFLESVSIIEFQHGIVKDDMAYPVIGVDATPQELELLDRQLKTCGVEYEDATGDEDVEFRIIHYNASLIERPFFIKIEFPERAGALHDFLKNNCQEANIVYFNYNYTGERVGRALIGFDFASEEARSSFRSNVLSDHGVLRAASEISEDAVKRIV